MMITLEDAKAHLNVTDSVDDALITSQIAAAEEWLLSFTGATYSNNSTVPEPMRQACRMLVANFYENREAVFAMNGTTAEMLPLGVFELIQGYREWAF